LLAVDDLHVEFDTYGGIVKAVRGVSFNVYAGKTLGIVGESGCGKSVTVQSIMGLTPIPPAGSRGQRSHGRHRHPQAESHQWGRHPRLTHRMIFQDPMSSLNPTMKVGDQIAETLQVIADTRTKRHTTGPSNCSPK
jgi:ABC-type dipeptide/oligopeptide/nickel transport system ATPase component